MKITIPSRGGQPIAPQDSQSDDHDRAGPVNPDAAGIASNANGTGRPSIKIKQQIPSTADERGDNDNDKGDVEQKEKGGLGVPAKRKRRSLTPHAPSGAGNATGVSAGRSQTRHAAPDYERIYEDGIKLFTTLKNAKKDGRGLSTEFMHLPPRQAFPDYYDTIRKPISFAEVKAKLERREFRSLKQVSDDFHQMFNNAKRYNQKGSNIFNDAKRLDKFNKSNYAKLTGTTTEVDSGDDAGSAPTTQNPTPASTNNNGGDSIADRKPPKKKPKKDNGPEKPMTLTKWLSIKVDDLVAVTDAKGRTYADIFMNLPDRDLYPDYYQLIQRPVSIQLVRSRLKNRNYPTIQAFIHDVETIFSNAQFYNEEGSQIWKDSNHMSEHFKTLMQDEPPEFHSRPRNRDQQQTQSQGKHEDVSAGSAGGRIKLKMESGQGEGDMSLDHPHVSYNLGQGGIENIAFADEFDDEDLVEPDDGEEDGDVEQQKQQHSTNQEQATINPSSQQKQPRGSSNLLSQGASPYLQPSQAHSATSQPLASTPRDVLSPPLSSAAQSQTGLQPPSQKLLPKNLAGVSKPKTLSRLSIGEVIQIKSFAVSLHTSSSTTPPLRHLLCNTIVRQHTLQCSRDVERIDIIPNLGNRVPASPPPPGKELKITMRPQHTVADTPCSTEEKAEGAGKLKWLTKPATGLNVVEVSTADGREVYRLFINKNTL